MLFQLYANKGDLAAVTLHLTKHLTKVTLFGPDNTKSNRHFSRCTSELLPVAEADVANSITEFSDLGRS